MFVSAPAYCAGDPAGERVAGAEERRSECGHGGADHLRDRDRLPECAAKTEDHGRGQAGRVYWRTTPRTTSQRVAPSARAPSFRSAGRS